jgi:hypothetical protein
MERKNDSTILLLVAAGLGIYWYINSKKKPIDNVSTQPVTEQPVSQSPVQTQEYKYDPSKFGYNPSMESSPEFKEIMKQVDVLEQKNRTDVTPVTDMFNTTLMTNFENKNVDNAVFNMNIAPIE